VSRPNPKAADTETSREFWDLQHRHGRPRHHERV